MSEHPLNAANRRVVAKAQEVLTQTGDLAQALRAAIKEATMEATVDVQLRHGPDPMLATPGVVDLRPSLANEVYAGRVNAVASNILYCGGRLERLEAAS